MQHLVPGGSVTGVIFSSTGGVSIIDLTDKIRVKNIMVIQPLTQVHLLRTGVSATTMCYICS